MKIDDILRVAYNKSLKNPGPSMTHADRDEEDIKQWIKSDYVVSLFENIFRLASKRRPLECLPISESYMERLINGFIEAGVSVIKHEPSYIWNKRSYEIQFNNFKIAFVYDSGQISFVPVNQRVYIVNPIPISDLIKYFFGVDELLKNLPDLVDKIRKDGLKLRKMQDILYNSAAVIIKDIELPEGVSIRFYLKDFYLRDSRILCILTQNDHPYPPYHKSCKSELGTLKEDIIKTIGILTKYKFRGYIED